MSERRWLLYGANGYTGTLIAREARRRGMKPILAGRNGPAVGTLADQLGLQHRVFPLDDPPAVARGLEGCTAVLLAAGPFSHTSGPLLDACLRLGLHYLNVTGEIEVFEACRARSAEARARGVVVLPGVGFDVVPSDCLAAILQARLPGATSLDLAFAAEGPVGPGTIKTMLEALPGGGAVRRDGEITRVPLFSHSRVVQFQDGPRRALSIPWGDVSTAWSSTGIPNIVVYVAVPPGTGVVAPALRLAASWLSGPRILPMLIGSVNRLGAQPGRRQPGKERCQLWAQVSRGDGQSASATLTTPGTYALIARTAVESIRRVLSSPLPAGTLTPSQAFGARYITEFEGCVLSPQ